MGNIQDYLKWRGDVPMSTDPFNEVDNLILAELSYTNFLNVPYAVSIDQGKCEGVLIGDVRDAYFALHDRREAENATSHLLRSPVLMDDMADGARFGGMSLAGYVSITDKSKNLQGASVTYLLDDGTAYVAFRGTDDSLVGWKEDMLISCRSSTEGQRLAAEHLTLVGRTLDRPLRVGGHSKGGNTAIYAAAFCEKDVQDKIIAVYSNDGPGFRREVLATEGYRQILPRIISLVPQDAVVGRLLNNYCDNIAVKSSASGILQHDAFTWKCLRGRFERSELSELSDFAGMMLGGWLEKMDDSNRERFVQLVFTLLESAGQDTFSGMALQKLKSIESMLKTLKDFSREDRQDLTDHLKKLLESSSEAASQFSIFNWKGEDDG